MARGKKTGGRDFKPGEVANPNGRPRLPGDIKSARALNTIEVERIYHEVLNTPQHDLDEWLLDTKRTVLEATVAKVMLEAMTAGDVIRLEKVLDRCVGPVKKQVEHSGTVTLEEIVAGSRKT